MESPAIVQYVSEWFIKPKYALKDISKQPLYLSPRDVIFVLAEYMQRGFIFAKPPGHDTDHQKNQLQELVQKLKESLSLTLVHFYPLAGRLAKQKKEDNAASDLAFYIDCNKVPGARFIQASLNLTVDDILSPTYVPQVVKSLFDHKRSINYDGHMESLLTIQVTELIDGIFIGCFMNHLVADGTSIWHFLNSWSEIFKADGKACCAISRPPVHIHDRLFFLGGRHDPFLRLPLDYDGDGRVIISRDHKADPLAPEDMLRERVFHFSSETVRKLKAKANAECNSTTEISSLQAVSAHLWRCTARAWNFPSDQTTRFLMVASARSRSVPPISQDCLGNHLQAVVAISSCGELVERGLGWASRLLHQAVINQPTPNKWLDSWLRSPYLIGGSNQVPDPGLIKLTGSPQFNPYGIEFGVGKPVGTRNENAGKANGKMTVNLGAEGGASMDILVCLLQRRMNSLESDMEFMEMVS